MGLLRDYQCLTVGVLRFSRGITMGLPKDYQGTTTKRLSNDYKGLNVRSRGLPKGTRAAMGLPCDYQRITQRITKRLPRDCHEITME